MALDLLLGTVADPILAGKVISGAWAENERLAKTGLDILKRHKFTCVGCGFKSRASKQYPSAHMVPVNLNHAGLLPVSVNDGVCLCPYCASSIAINWSTEQTRRDEEGNSSPGMLIYCAWIEQSKLNLLANHCCAYTAFADPRSSKMTGAAVRDIDSTMVSLNQELGARLPIYRGNDAEFSRALSMLPVEFYAKRVEVISHVRWWPNLSYWKGAGEYFYKAVYEAFDKKNAAEVE